MAKDQQNESLNVPTIQHIARLTEQQRLITFAIRER